MDPSVIVFIIQHIKRSAVCYYFGQDADNDIVYILLNFISREMKFVFVSFIGTVRSLTRPTLNSKLKYTTFTQDIIEKND